MTALATVLVLMGVFVLRFFLLLVELALFAVVVAVVAGGAGLLGWFASRRAVRHPETPE